MRDVKVRISGDNQVGKTFKQVAADADHMGKAVETNAKRSARSMDDFKIAAGLAGAAIGVAIGVSIKNASNLSETLNKSAVVFGKSADQIEDFGDSSATALGISKQAAIEAAATFGNLFQTMGLGQPEAANMSTSLVQLASDLASFNNIGTDEALEKLRAGLVGEIEPLRSVGVQINETAVKAELLRLGVEKVNGEFTEADKVQARYNLILQQTTTAQGDFARTSDGMANSTRIARAELANASAELGTALIPAVTQTAQVVGDLAHAFGELPDSVQSGVTISVASLAALTVAAAGVGKVVSTLGPVIEFAGGAAGVAAGGAGLGGLASATLLLGGAVAALAVPIGIATYLIVTQDDVMRKATETTLANKDALEGYVNYLNSINVDDSAVAELSQQMHELFDWATKTSAADLEALIDPNLNVIGDEFVTTLGSMSDELLALDPSQLDQVVQLMKDLGIETNRPDTWNTENVALLTEFIYLLSKQERDAGYEAYELARAQSGANVAMAASAEVTEATAQAMLDLSKIEKAQADEYESRRARFEEGSDAFAEAQEKQRAAMEAEREASEALDESLGELAQTLQRDFAGAAAAGYNRVVGFTSGMVGAIEKSKDWSDALFAPIGTDVLPTGKYSELFNLLQAGKIDVEDYNEASQAQVDINDALARSTEAANIIQIKQADTVAEGAVATADYLQRLSELDEAEQAIALAWADPALAGRVNDIADMAGEFGNMDTAQKKAFENMVESAAAADPALATLLESVGLIKRDVEDPTGWQLIMDTSDAESDTDRLITALGNIAELMEAQYLLDARATLDDTEFWTAYYNLPSSKDLTLYIHQTPVGSDYGGHAYGGPVRFASGGVARLAELGPELLRYPSGAMGLAMTDGLYALPNGTQVDTANATREKLGVGSGDGFHIHGDVYVYPATPDVQAAIVQQYLGGGV